MDTSNISNTNISQAIEEMFEKCDPNKTGIVRVSTLISFMNPFMEDRLEELTDLRNILDPDDINAEINKDEFLIAIQKWPLTQTDDTDNQSEINITNLPNILSPIEENNTIVLKLKNDETSSFRTASTDKVEQQVEIERLTKENQKILEDYSNLKKLLENSEDANVVLQCEIANLTTNLKIEQRANVQAKVLHSECQELREANHTQHKNIKKLTNEIVALQNEKRKVEKLKEKLEEQNELLTQNVNQIKSHNSNLTLAITKSTLEIEQLTNELAKCYDNDFSQKNLIAAHQKEVDELKKMIEYYKEEKKRLETEQKEIARRQFEESNKSIKDTTSTSSTNSPIKNSNLESSSDDSILLELAKSATFPEKPSLFSELCEISEKSVKDNLNLTSIQQLQSEISSLKKGKVDVENLEIQLEKIKKDNDKLQIEIVQINTSNLNLSNKNTQLKKIIEVYKQELLWFKLNLDAFKNSCLEQFGTFKDTYYVQINYAEKMLKTKHDEMKQQLLQLQNELKDHSQVLIEKQTFLDKTITENNQLKSKTTQLQIELNQEMISSNKYKNEFLKLDEEQKNLKDKLNYINLQSKAEKDEVVKENRILHEQKQQIIDCTSDILFNFNNFKELHEAINKRLEQGMGDHEQCGKCFDLQTELLPYSEKYKEFEESLKHLRHLQDSWEDLIEENSSQSGANLKQTFTKADKKKSRDITDRKFEKISRNLEAVKSKNEKLSTQLSKMQNENKNLKKTNDEQLKENIKFKEEINKFKHYLEETNKKLSIIFHNILGKLHDEKISSALLDLQNENDIFKFGKNRYYEPYYVKFNQNLEQCISFLQLIMSNNVFSEILNSSDDSSQAELSNNSLLQRSKHSEIHLRPASLIFPTKSPALSSIAKIKLTPVSPDSPSARKIMTETTTVLIHDPPKLNQTHPIFNHELNNNISEDSRSNAPLISSTDCSTTVTNGDILMDNSESLAAVSDNHEVPVISIVEETIIINQNSDTEEKQHSSNKSTSASSTNSSGSTESLNIEPEPVSHKSDLHSSYTVLENHSQNDEDSPSSHQSRSPQTRSRSQSLGEADTTEDIDAFPNIPDSLLEELGLLDNDATEETYEQDEIEQKFTTLNLAFTTDMLSLEIRKERIQRHREQAENNLRKEVIRLQQGVHKLNPLCIDAERTQLVTNLLTQIDVLLQAEWQVSTMTQYFGAIMQEVRLSKSVKLMLKYVENLKLQRDTARKHFQCTKRMLQDSNTKAVKVSTQNKKNLNTSANSQNVNNLNRLITRRRASIATIQRPLTSPPESLRLLNSRRPSPSNVSPSSEIFVNRRTEFPEQLITSPVRQRLLRIEGSTEHLQNIKENMEVENSDSENSDSLLQEDCKLEEPSMHHQVGVRICNTFRRILGDNLHSSGVLHELFSLGALICFFLALSKIINILLMLSNRNENFTQSSIYTWSDISTAFLNFFNIVQSFLN